MLGQDQVLVIYDGGCRFCTAAVHVLDRLDWRDRLYALPYQTRGLPEAVGTTVSRARQEALAFSPAGRLWSGGGAMAATVDALLPFGLPLLRALYLVPGLHWVVNRVYEGVSAIRSKLPGIGPDLEPGEEPPLDPQVAAELARRRLATAMPTALPGPGLAGPETLH